MSPLWHAQDRCQSGMSSPLHPPFSETNGAEKAENGWGKEILHYEEVLKLSDTRFIIETKYSSWQVNVVLVRKANNRWHTCVDFTIMNVVCLKDSYRPPDINRLINGSSGYRRLNSMNVFSRYNQIWMDPVDTPKTTFMSNHDNHPLARYHKLFYSNAFLKLLNIYCIEVSLRMWET